MSKFEPAEVWLVKDTHLDLGTTPEKYKTGILALDGAIYCPPWNASKVIRITTLKPKDAAHDAESVSGPSSRSTSRSDDGESSVATREAEEEEVSTESPVRELDFDLGPEAKKWRTAILGKDGNVYCPPYNAGSVLCIVPAAETDAEAEVQVKLLGPDFGATEGKWKTAFLGRDGNIYCPPFGGNKVLRISPASGAVELIGPDLGPEPDKYQKALMGKNGYAYCAPLNASRVLRIDTKAGEVELVGPSFGDQQGKWWTQLHCKDGNIYCPPFNASKILRIDVTSGAVEFFGPDFGPQKGKYWTAVLGKDGSAYCPPCCAAKVLRIDPLLGMAQFIGMDHCLGGYKWRKAYVGPSDNIFCLPWNGSRVLKIDISSGLVKIIGPDLDFGGSKFAMGCVHTEGNIFCPPTTDMPTVLRINTLTDEVVLVGNLKECTAPKCGDAVLGSDGKVYLVPMSAQQVYRLECWKPQAKENAGAAATGGEGSRPESKEG